ncbi:MAG: hypothetical protein U0228_32130 [Myxococcaceae bacterium]
MLSTLLVVLSAAPGATLGAGLHFACALEPAGTVACWGANESLQLGDPSRQNHASPVRVPGLRGARDLALGSNHACVVTTADEVWCWGGNGPASCGDPIDLELSTPRQVQGLPPVARVFAGHSTTCAISRDGKAWCWGRNLNGEAGRPRSEASEVGLVVPREVPEVSDVEQLAIGESHACARSRDGAVWCWGSNEHGRAGGDGRSVGVTRVKVGPAAFIATTSNASFAVLRDGTLSYWGTWSRDRDFEAAPRPKTTEDRGVTALFTSRFTAYVKGADGWRFPKSGLAPLLPAADLSWASELVAGDSFACGRASPSEVRCWGFNREGLGIGPGEQVKTPTALAPLAEVAPRRTTAKRSEQPCTSPPTSELPAPVGPPMGTQCGNGTRDVVSVIPGQCAPCAYGNTNCPCSPTQEIREVCDGKDLGNASCASLGQGEGTLRCTPRCTFDTSGCAPVSQLPPGGAMKWSTPPVAQAPAGPLALAAKGKELGVLWAGRGGCGQVFFARANDSLALGPASTGFGRAVDRVELVATTKGWLAALGTVGATAVHAVDASGKPGPERALLIGRPVFLVGAPEGPFLLGLSTRDHSYLGGLDVALVNGDGAVLSVTTVFAAGSQTSESMASFPSQADLVTAVPVPGGFLVARGQSVPGREEGGVVVARLRVDGGAVRVEQRSVVARGVGSARFVGPRAMVVVRNVNPPGQVGRFAVDRLELDERGAPVGPAVPIADLEEAEWFLGDAVSVGNDVLLVPRLHMSGSTLVSDQLTRLSLVETPKLRTTVVEVSGVRSGRLAVWGSLLVVGTVVFSGDQARLGLAKLAPASAR